MKQCKNPENDISSILQLRVSPWVPLIRFGTCEAGLLKLVHVLLKRMAKGFRMV